MDFRIRRTDHTAAVPLDGDFAVGVVLRSETRDGREFEIDAVHRRTIHTNAGEVPYHHNLEEYLDEYITFRATGITAYLKNNGTLRSRAAHREPREPADDQALRPNAG
jgi:hypothetical protein